MNIVRFSQIARTNREATRYLVRVCDDIDEIGCPRCGADEAYGVGDGKRRRCRSCRHTFDSFGGRWIHGVRISPRKWLWIIKLFELGMTSKKISEETGVSYPTVLKATNTIRFAIISKTEYGRMILGGEDLAATIPVFHWRHGDGSKKPPERIPREQIVSVQRLSRGCFICTDARGTGNFVLCEGIRHFAADIQSRLPDRRIFLPYGNGEWSYIKERLAKFHGVKESMLPIYLAMLEYRYANRNRMLFDLIVENLCSPIDDPAAPAPDSGLLTAMASTV